MVRLRVVAVALVALLVVVVSPARAIAVPIGDPWVPPSVVTHDGVADPRGALAGVGLPLVAGAALVDVLTPATAGATCTRRVISWGWSGLLFTYNYAVIGGSSPNYCNTTYLVVGYALGCITTAAGVAADGLTHGVGEAFERASTYSNFTGSNSPAYQPSITNFNCGATAVVFYVRSFGTTGNNAADAFLSYRPGAVPSSGLAVLVTVTCSDASTVSASFPAGADVTLPTCVTGDLASVTYATGSQAVGHVGVVEPYRGNPCLDAGAACFLLASAAGVTCANTDAGCEWWGGTDPATGCAWTNGVDMWSVAPSDCEAARHDGWDVVPDRGGGTTPTDPVPVDLGPVVSAVEAAAAAAAAAAAQAAAVAESIKDAVLGIPEAIGRIFVPDPGVLDGSVSRITASGPGPELAPWFDAVGDMASAATVHPSSDCLGPPLTIADTGGTHLISGTYYLLQACTPPMSGVAIFCKIALTALTAIAGLNACIRGILSGFDLRWDLSITGVDGMGNASVETSGSHRW